MRSSISKVLKEIQDESSIENETLAAKEGNSYDMLRNSIHSSLNMGSLDLVGYENYLSLDESIALPTTR